MILEILSKISSELLLSLYPVFVFSYENKFSPENSEKPTLAFRFISVFSYIGIPENNRKLTLTLQFTM